MKFIISISLMLLFYVLWLYIIYAVYTPSVINGTKKIRYANLRLPTQTAKSLSVINNTHINREGSHYLKKEILQEDLLLVLEEIFEETRQQLKKSYNGLLKKITNVYFSIFTRQYSHNNPIKLILYNRFLSMRPPPFNHSLM